MSNNQEELVTLTDSERKILQEAIAYEHNPKVVSGKAVTDFNKGVIYACAELVRNWDLPSIAQEIIDTGVDANYLDGVAEEDLDALRNAGMNV